MFTFKSTGASSISSGVSTILNDERPHFYRSLDVPITSWSTGFCPESSCLYDLFRNWLFGSFPSISIVFIDCFECTTQEVARTYFSLFQFLFTDKTFFMAKTTKRKFYNRALM